MDFHDGISFDGIKLDGWNLLQSAFNLILLNLKTRHNCQIISLACIIVIFNIVNIVFTDLQHELSLVDEL